MFNVYIITNLANNMKYVGVTTKELKVRLNEHSRKGYCKTSILSKAIQKYGKENFKIELLYSARDKKEMFEKESEYIKELNVLAPNGYNLVVDGIAYKDSNYVPRMSDKCREAGWKANRGLKRSELARKRMSEAKPKEIPLKRKHIIAINLIDNTRQEFLGISFAAKELKENRRSISNILNGWAYKTRNNYTFIYKESQ